MNKLAIDPVNSAEIVAPGQSTPEPVPVPSAPVNVPRKSFVSSLKLMAGRARVMMDNTLPTVVMLALLLGIWQIACSGPDASLPPPLKVFAETQELIFHPFYEGSGTDKGLGWQILASLERVACTPSAPTRQNWGSELERVLVSSQ